MKIKAVVGGNLLLGQLSFCSTTRNKYYSVSDSEMITDVECVIQLSHNKPFAHNNGVQPTHVTKYFTGVADLFGVDYCDGRQFPRVAYPGTG